MKLTLDKKMKFRNAIILFASLVLTILPSCHKKDDETITYNYLTGTPSFEMPIFVDKGESFTLTPKGITNPTGDVGYYWTASWDNIRDTVKTEGGAGDGSWTVTVPNSIGSYTIKVTAFAKDYVPSNYNNSFTVVDPSIDGSLTRAGYQVDSSRFIDPRDGSTYYLATGGGNVWMQNSLSYAGSGVSYEYSPAMDKIAGRMYTWNEAVNACPEGWHLPSDKDFAALATSATGTEFNAGQTFHGAAGAFMVDAYFNDGKMWTFWPEVKITNKAKFCAIPLGYAIDQEDSRKYTGTDVYAVFWTSDSDEDSGVYRYIHVEKSDVFASSGDKDSFRAFVRCVKDKE